MSAAPRTNSVAESPEPGPGFRLLTFGAPGLSRTHPDGRAERVLGNGKVLALLIYLAAVRGRPHPREQLADLLWGDESPENARGSLRQALYVLRGLVGEDRLEADREQVRFEPRGVAADFVEFETALRDGQFEAALALYAGPFCARLDVGGAEAAARWLAVERTRLEQSYVDAVSRCLEERLKRGALADAARIARALVAAAPEHSDAIAAAYDALVAAGEMHEARELLARHQGFLAAADLELPPPLRQRIAAQAKLLVPVEPERTRSAQSIGRAMVGRDAELSALLAAAEQVREGGVRRVLLRGAGGLGKTRLLEEFEARVRLRGVRVVRVRCLEGMRDVPLSALADVVAALADLPGALGVSERAATTLAAAFPHLSGVYPAVRNAEPSAAPDLLAIRWAYAELLSTVSVRRLLVLLLDDIHLADESSRSVLAAARRADGVRLVEVWAARPVLAAEPSDADASLQLAPLSDADIRALFTAVAPFGDAALEAVVLRRLSETARGVPQLVIAAIRSAVGAGLLRHGDSGWETDDPAALDVHLVRAVSPTAALESASGAAGRVLSVLALWNRPIAERDLVGVAALLPDPVTEPDVRTALGELEARGLVRALDVSWSLAHDSIRDAMRELPSFTYDPALVLRALIEHWSHESRVSVEVVTALALLSGHRPTWDAARRLVVRVAAPRVYRRLGVSPRALPGLIAKAAGRPEWTAVLRRDLGVLASLGDAGRVLAGAAAATLGLALLWLGWMLQPRLVLEADPIGQWMHPDYAHAALLAQPSALVTNGFGQQLPLRVPVRISSDAVDLRGDTVVTSVRGKAQFERLEMRGRQAAPDDSPLEVTLSGPWWVRPVRVRVQGATVGLARDHFRVTRVVINGEDVSATRLYTARRTDSLRFVVTYDFTTTLGNAFYVVGAAPTWAKGDEQVVRVGHLPTPVRTAVQTSQFTILPPRELVDSGYVAILSDAEESVEFVFSATTWTVGKPVWGDGNDVMELGAEAMEGLRRRGSIVVPGTLQAPIVGRPPDELTAAGPRVWEWPQTVKPQTRRLQGSAVLVRFR